jgi:hypothetical protein
VNVENIPLHGLLVRTGVYGCVTTRLLLACALQPRYLPVIVQLPSPIAVTRPVEDTVATLVLELVHIAGCEDGAPDNINCWVAPIAPIGLEKPLITGVYKQGFCPEQGTVSLVLVVAATILKELIT